MVGVNQEDFRLLGRDSGAALDERGHDAICDLNAERKGGDIEEVLGLLGGVPLRMAPETAAPMATSKLIAFCWSPFH